MSSPAYERLAILLEVFLLIALTATGGSSTTQTEIPLAEYNPHSQQAQHRNNGPKQIQLQLNDNGLFYQGEAISVETAIELANRTQAAGIRLQPSGTGITFDAIRNALLELKAAGIPIVLN
ncbi:MAG: hypothetical protein ABW148_16425 [Sedimenticola sp.]